VNPADTDTITSETDAEEQVESENLPSLNCIYFYLTEGCNLACRHCWIAPKFQNADKSYGSLDPSLFRSIIWQAQAMGLSSVKLTGGEPLIHPQIEELLEFVRGEELKLTLETNGVACTPEIVERIAACQNPFVSVSLDGAKAESHEWVRGVEGCFEKSLEGLRNLVAGGLKPQIIMTVMRHNRGEMEDLVRLAEDIGAASVKFNICQPTGRGEAMHASEQTLTMDELLDLGEWVEGELKDKTSLRVVHSHPHAFQPMSRMFDDEQGGCGRCGIHGIIGVLASGSYALCGIGETVPELVFGDATQTSLAKVWAENPVINTIRDGVPNGLEGVCGRCAMSGMCLGSCVAQNYYATQNLLSAFWYCTAADEIGRFPESRKRPPRAAAE